MDLVTFCMYICTINSRLSVINAKFGYFWVPPYEVFPFCETEFFDQNIDTPSLSGQKGEFLEGKQRNFSWCHLTIVLKTHQKLPTFSSIIRHFSRYAFCREYFEPYGGVHSGLIDCLELVCFWSLQVAKPRPSLNSWEKIR